MLKLFIFFIRSSSIGNSIFDLNEYIYILNKIDISKIVNVISIYEILLECEVITGSFKIMFID